MKTTIACLLLWMGIFFSVQAQLNKVFYSNFYLYDMYCLNSDTVFACGRGGRILKTYNGGVSWQKDSLATKQDLFSIIMRKTGIGYIAGDSGTLYKTTNYGTSWSKVPVNINGMIQKLEFYNDSCGYIVMEGILHKTTNYGKDCNFVHQFENLTQINCFGNDTIFIGTIDGIYATHNAGIKWDTLFIDRIFGMKWQNRDVGYITTFDYLYKTIDGGNTFKPIKDVYYPNKNIIIINDSILIISGNDYAGKGTDKTLDGGKTWLHYPEFARMAIFLNKDTGYIISVNSIYKTTNGSIKYNNTGTNIIKVKNKSKRSDIVISPNPMDLVCQIQLPANCSYAHYKLFDNLGQLIEENNLSPSSSQIFRNHKPSGVYILSITDFNNNLIANLKLVIK